MNQIEPMERFFPDCSDYSRNGVVIETKPIRFFFKISVLFGSIGKYSHFSLTIN